MSQTLRSSRRELDEYDIPYYFDATTAGIRGMLFSRVPGAAECIHVTSITLRVRGPDNHILSEMLREKGPGETFGI